MGGRGGSGRILEEGGTTVRCVCGKTALSLQWKSSEGGRADSGGI